MRVQTVAARAYGHRRAGRVDAVMTFMLIIVGPDRAPNNAGFRCVR
jgi:hypothetical protein